MQIEVKSKLLRCHKTGDCLTLYKGSILGYFNWYWRTWRVRRRFRKEGERLRKALKGFDSAVEVL